ncbi:MAG: hypothetical protein H0W44_06145 [Gammaproteobacteria bacterium]|nr:hypothetical protein [Gammaproteobacteria bacterium]
MPYYLYIIGALIFISGLIYAGTLLNIPTEWLIAVAAIILGLIVLKSSRLNRFNDPNK